MAKLQSSATFARGQNFYGATALGYGVAALVVVLCANPAAAQKSTEIEEMKQEIRALREKLNRIQGGMKARRETSPEKHVVVTKGASPAGGAASPSLDNVSFPNGRPTLSSDNFTFGVYGRTQIDVGGYFNESGRDFNSGWNLRRARLGAVGSVWKDFTYSLIYDFGGSPDGTGSLYEASVGYRGWKSFNFRIGAFKPFFSLEDSISSADLLFQERPSIVEIARSVAAGTARMSAGGSWAEPGWFASAYLTGPTVGTEANDEQLGGVARVAMQPLRGTHYLLHLGASGAAVFAPTQNAAGIPGISTQTIQLRDRPELRIDSTRLIDTGLISYSSAYTGGAEVAGHWNNLSLQAEYYTINVNQDRTLGLPSPNLTFNGYYIQGSWIITGENRAYSTSSAAYAQPRVANPIHSGGWGTWEVVGRYSYTDLNDKDLAGLNVAATGGVRGGEQSVYAAGLNWYPNNNIRFMLNYLNGNVDRLSAAGAADIGRSFQALSLRTQFSF